MTENVNEDDEKVAEKPEKLNFFKENFESEEKQNEEEETEVFNQKKRKKTQILDSSDEEDEKNDVTNKKEEISFKKNNVLDSSDEEDNVKSSDKVKNYKSFLDSSDDEDLKDSDRQKDSSDEKDKKSCDRQDSSDDEDLKASDYQKGNSDDDQKASDRDSSDDDKKSHDSHSDSSDRESVKKKFRKKKKKDFSVLKNKKPLKEENLKDELSRELFSDIPDISEISNCDKKQRKSKTNALEEIRSETQRLIRESRVALPYHVPKQRTLADFLKRRQSISAVSLRTPKEHMTKVWQQIEEREKEAEDFYKSSDDENDKAIPKEEIAEKVEVNEKQENEEIPPEMPEKEEEKDEIPEKEEEMPSGFTQNLSELDLHLTEEFSEPKFVPKLSGDPNQVIDLDIEKPKFSAMGLLKRFIKHTSLQKPQKEDTTFSVVSSEVDEKGQIVNIKEETVKVKSENPKPGESLVKLKATLQQQMAIRREELLAKRREEMKIYENECLGEKDEEEEEFEIEDSGSSDDDDEKEEEEEEKEKNLMFDDEAEEDVEETEDVEENEDVDETADVEETEEEDEETKECEEKKFPDSTVGNNSEDDHLLSLCSGKFPSQPFDMHSLEKDDLNLEISDDEKNDDLLNLCSGTFPSQPFDMRSLEKDDAIAHDSDSDSDEGFGLTKKRCKKLVYEDEDEETEDKGDAEDEDAEEVNEEDDEDEEEVEDEETELAKKLSRGFLDGEAELSGSEWGSDDEDEKDLDRFEAEEGDAEKISERKLQKELGRIHMREIMNEDKREVQLLQEIFLEDGELHSDGPKRQRLFRWTNQDDDALNNLPRNPFDDDEDVDEVPEDEELWRQQRVEREKFLKEKKIDNLIIEEETVNISKNFKPKFTPKSPSRFKVVNRGSFLTRSEKMLSKLANMTSSSDNPIANTRGRGMVFASISPPKDLGNPVKRKGDDLKSGEVKKIKTVQPVPNKSSIFDKLKMSD